MKGENALLSQALNPENENAAPVSRVKWTCPLLPGALFLASEAGLPSPPTAGFSSGVLLWKSAHGPHALRTKPLQIWSKAAHAIERVI